MMAPMPSTHNSQGQRLTASQVYRDRDSLNEIMVPFEEMKGTGCCWRLFCPCYYLFCCCWCCEQGLKINRMRFVQRFNKWVSIRKNPKFYSASGDVIKGLIKLYAHQDQEAISDLR